MVFCVHLIIFLEKDLILSLPTTSFFPLPTEQWSKLGRCVYLEAVFSRFQLFNVKHMHVMVGGGERAKANAWRKVNNFIQNMKIALHFCVGVCLVM